MISRSLSTQDSAGPRSLDHAAKSSATRHGSAWLRSALRGLLALAVMFSTASLFAQDTESPSDTPPATDDAGDAAPGDAGAEPAAGAEPQTAWEQLIYLPYRNLKEVLGNGESTVFMPYADYLKLFRPGNQAGPLEVDAVITQSHYSARVDRSILRINAELTVQVLGKPWVQVPLNFGQAAVGSMTVAEGSQVLLQGQGDGRYALLFGSTGEHKVTLELAVAIATSPDGRSIEFNVPPVGVTTFELVVPEADQTVDITPQLITMPVEAADGETRVKVNLGSTTKVAAKWHPQTSRRPDMDLLAAVTSYQKVTLRDDLAHTDATLDYDVLRGELTQVTIAVPTGHRILAVTSANSRIRGWKAQPGDDGQQVVVEFLSPVRGHAVIEVHTEREFGSDPLELAGRADTGEWHGIHAVDAVRESGQLAIVVANDLSLQFEQITGLARIEENEVAEAIRQPGAATFKFYSSNIRLQALVRPVEPRLTVDSLYRCEFHDDELRLHATLNYTVDRAGVFELRVKLPPDLVIDSVTDQAGQMREFHVEDGADRTLRIVFKGRTAPDAHLAIDIRGHVKFEEASEVVDIMLPIPEPDSATVEREVGRVVVLAPDSLDVVTTQEDVIAAQPLPAVGDVEQRAGYRQASAWTFNRRPVEIPVSTRRRPTRLSATVATTVNVKEELTEVQSDLTWNVQFAGIDTFRFSVPASVSDVQIESLEGPSAPAIKQKVAAEEAVDGWIVWTVTMQRDVLGQHRFRVTWDLPKNGAATVEANAAEANAADGAVPPAEAAAEDAPADGAAEAEPAAAAQPAPVRNGVHEALFETLRALGLEESDDTPAVALSDVYGEVLINKEQALAVNATTMDEALEAIDVRELSLLEQNGALAYRYYRQPVALKIETTKHEIQKVVETVVTRGLIEVVARRDDRLSVRCRYAIRSSERQRVRVDVPLGAELLGAFIDGQAINPEKNTQPRDEQETKAWDSYFINVARQNNSDRPFSLTLQMMVSVGEVPFEDWGGSLLVRLPQFGGVGGSGVAVQQLQTLFWVPREFRLTGDPDNFINETSLPLEEALIEPSWRRTTDYFDGDEWIQIPNAGFIDFPTEGNRFRFSNLGGAETITITWANVPNYTWLFSGALLIIAVLLRGLSWDTRLLLLLLAAFGAAMASLSSPGWSAEIVSASRYGLFGLISIWVLHSIFTFRFRASESSDQGDQPPPQPPQPRFEGPWCPMVSPPPGVFDPETGELTI